MKICYFTQEDKITPGASRSLIDLLTVIKNEENIQPIVILPKHGEMEKKLSEMNIEYLIIPTYSTSISLYDKSISKHIKYILKRMINYISIRKIIKNLRKRKVDIIHINKITGTVGAEVALKLGIPYIFHIREFLEEDHKRKFYDKKRSYNLLRKSSSIVAISGAIKNKYESILNRKIDLIYNGIPIEKYIIKISNRFNNSCTNILLTGRISEGKGQLEAIQALNNLCKKLPNNQFKLFLVGDIGDEQYYEKIQKYIKENRLETTVEYVPFTNDLRAIRSKCDIGILCSQKEAFGRVTIETMLSSMLFIGTNSGGTKELVSNQKTGLLYEPGDYIDLRDKIVYALTHKEEMNTIIKNARDFAVNNYSINNTANNVLMLYKRLIN
ncbi:glycosyltransferase family 4 protein [Heyndrickxia coagulans]|uniref:glycosyltransferase family 4 protein n=1 Tax=Heyndrickxia coagulans TaxID=1398 RepID=UPI0023E37A0D|nr:glycosyltransferase family 4 protein [Heyndrickxia coagulans]